MANKKFSEFVLKTSTSDVSHIVGYNGAENVQITPANFVTGGGTGVFLPLAGGTMVGNTIHNDNVKSIYGNPGNDLEIFHDGFNSRIKDVGTGSLILNSGQVVFQNAAASETLLTATENNSVDLYYNNAKKFETTSVGISVTGNGVFSGDVIVGSTNPVKLIDQSYGGELGLYYGTTNHWKQYHFSDNSLRFNYNGSGGDELIIDTSGSATFTSTTGQVITDTSGHITSFQTLDVSTAGGRFNGKSNRGLLGSINIEQTTTGADGGYIRFLTSPNGSTTPIEKMRLDASGNLGIGTSSPTEKIQISGTNANNKIVSYFDGNFISGFKFSDLNGGIWYDAGLDDLHLSAAQANSQMLFEVAGAEKMRLDASGKLQLQTAGGYYLTENTTNAFSITSDGANGSLIFTDEFNSSERMRIDSAGDVSFTGNSHTPYIQLVNSGRTAANPGFTFNNDTNTGMFQPSGVPDTIAFSTGGGERMRINSDGNVGVGMTSGFNAVSGTEKTVGILNSNVASLYLQSTATNGKKYGIYSASSGQLAFYDFNAAVEIMRITDGNDVEITGGYASSTAFQSTGSLRISSNSTTNNSNIALELLNDASSTRFLASFTNSNGIVGSISTVGTATAYNTSSDYRLKEDLQDFEGLDLISKIPVYDFKWKVDESRSYGVMAHELQEVLPQAVVGEKDAEEMQGVDYSKIVPLLVKSIQELKAEIELLKNK